MHPPICPSISGTVPIKGSIPRFEGYFCLFELKLGVAIHVSSEPGARVVWPPPGLWPHSLGAQGQELKVTTQFFIVNFCLSPPSTIRFKHIHLSYTPQNSPMLFPLPGMPFSSFLLVNTNKCINTQPNVYYNYMLLGVFLGISTALITESCHEVCLWMFF